MYRCVLVQRETPKCTDVFWFGVELLDVQMCFGLAWNYQMQKCVLVRRETTTRCTDVFWFGVKLLNIEYQSQQFTMYREENV